MDTGEIFGLRHFQRHREGALLPFAAKLGGWLVVQQQLKFVAMRPDQRGAICALTLSGLGQFQGEILFYTGLILQAQFLGIIGNAAIGRSCEW